MKVVQIAGLRVKGIFHMQGIVKQLQGQFIWVLNPGEASNQGGSVWKPAEKWGEITPIKWGLVSPQANPFMFGTYVDYFRKILIATWNRPLNVQSPLELLLK